MSDVTVKPIDVDKFNEMRFGPAGKVIPVYFVIVEDVDSKGKLFKRHFIATKFDEGTNFAKLVGFYTEATNEKINQGYKEIINSVDKQLYVEVLIPWQKVISIQNLIFRQK